MPLYVYVVIYLHALGNRHVDASIGWWSCYTAKTITRAGYSACFQSDRCAFLFPSACHLSAATSQGGQTMAAACSNSSNHPACPSAATIGPIGPSANTAWDVGARGSGVGHCLGGLNARGVDSPDYCNCNSMSQRPPAQKCRTARRFFQPLYQGMGHTNGLAVRLHLVMLRSAATLSNR